MVSKLFGGVALVLLMVALLGIDQCDIASCADPVSGERMRCVWCSADDGNECAADTWFIPEGNDCSESNREHIDDGTVCGNGIGVCRAGACEFPCTEQGVRDAIAAGGGPHRFACAGPTTVVTTSEIVIDNNVILEGGRNLTVDGDGDHRVFRVLPPYIVELRGLTVTNGAAGGIYNQGTLTLRDCSVSRNNGLGTGGIWSTGKSLTLINSVVSGNTGDGHGGISARGTLTLTNSTVSDNVGLTGGIAIYPEFIEDFEIGGDLTLTNSTVSGNTGVHAGGISTGGTAQLTNSTVSGNAAAGEQLSDRAGGISNYGTLTLTNSTVSGNAAADSGSPGLGSTGGILNWGTLVLAHSALTANTGVIDDGIRNHDAATLTNSVVDGDCGGALVTSNGQNIESPGDTCGFDQGADQVNVSADDLKLGELADNGGPTMTHALLPGSVAIDVIPAVDCVDAEGEPLTTDQRGFPRDSMCDVGAFELQP
jgi:hypothetical protein